MKELIKDWSPFIAFVLLGILVLMMFKRCDSEPKKIEPTKLQKKIQTDLKQDVQLKDSAKISDSVRVIYKTKYVYIRTNPEKLPCDTFVKVLTAYCDTVIQKDTLEILALKKVIKQDSTVIADYQQQANLDSVTITKLEKKVKRTRTIAKASFIVGLGLGGGVGVKLR